MTSLNEIRPHFRPRNKSRSPKKISNGKIDKTRISPKMTWPRNQSKGPKTSLKGRD